MKRLPLALALVMVAGCSDPLAPERGPTRFYAVEVDGMRLAYTNVLGIAPCGFERVGPVIFDSLFVELDTSVGGWRDFEASLVSSYRCPTFTAGPSTYRMWGKYRVTADSILFSSAFLRSAPFDGETFTTPVRFWDDRWEQVRFAP